MVREDDYTPEAAQRRVAELLTPEAPDDALREREAIIRGRHARAGGLPLAPPRGELAPDVEVAARAISREVWGEPYRPGHGPMHHAGGGYWHAELLNRAEKWEHLARAARICADALPTGRLESSLAGKTRTDTQQELREAMERDCPCCGAPAGFPCNAPMGGVFLKQPHLSRRLESPRGE